MSGNDCEVGISFRSTFLSYYKAIFKLNQSEKTRVSGHMIGAFRNRPIRESKVFYDHSLRCSYTAFYLILVLSG